MLVANNLIQYRRRNKMSGITGRSWRVMCGGNKTIQKGEENTENGEEHHIGLEAGVTVLPESDIWCLRDCRTENQIVAVLNFMSFLGS